MLPLVVYIGGKIEDIRYENEVNEEYSEISFKVPESFEKLGRFHSYSYYENDITCRFSILSSKKYEEDFEKWFKGTIFSDLNDVVGTTTEVDLNGNKALYVEVKTSVGIEHHYGLISSNYYYHIEYDINDDKKGDREDVDTNICYKSENEFLSSIETK